MTRPAPRWRRRKQARPQEILDAALDLFAERGFAATRLEDVAARAGVTKGTVYLYFKTKEELFEALGRAALLTELEEFEAAAASGTATELLERMVAKWVAEFVPSRAGVLPKLIIAEVGNFPDLAKFYLEEFVLRVLGLVRRVLARGITAGEFRPVDVEYTAYLFVAPLLLTALWTHSFANYAGHRLDAAAVGRAHLDVLLAGLRPSPVPAGRRRGVTTRGES
jgi:AcrR family transcriptional regulator